MNNLMDADLYLVEELVEFFPDIILDLSMNRIHGYNLISRKQFDIAFMAILSRVKYLVIAGNPVASVDRVDLFGKFTKNDFEKLIWIPHPWVRAGQWKTMADPKYWDLIEKTHEDFYKQNK